MYLFIIFRVPRFKLKEEERPACFKNKSLIMAMKDFIIMKKLMVFCYCETIANVRQWKFTDKEEELLMSNENGNKMYLNRIN